MFLTDFIEIINKDFYTGVPDSLLRPLCDYLMDTYGEDPLHHIIAANEGNAVGIAAGFHLATGMTPVIYMQNSGQGNVVNPFASLLHEKVYAIPAIFVIGWRGEPGIKDEPQHAFQGEITLSLLKELGIESFVVTAKTTVDELSGTMKTFNHILDNGKQVAFVIEKGALTNPIKRSYKNDFMMKREDILREILKCSKDDIIVATTGKTGREVFELREEIGEGHEKDFLTVGSMGHASSIALGIAIHKPDKRVWCIDGDGAALMHMGAIPVIAKAYPENLIHIVINNNAHESVGALPTASKRGLFTNTAKEAGYKAVYYVDGEISLKNILQGIDSVKGPVMVEIESAIASRDNLGRPTISPIENKLAFMKNLQ